MGKFHDSLTEEHIAFINRQHLFFVGTAPRSDDGHVNLSPKGLDAFRVLSPGQVAYMDLIGSGNETSAHLLENGRITFMFCAFEGAPNILRLYGKGRTVLPSDDDWAALSAHFTIYPSTRQIMVADITRIQTSCGFGVPLYDYRGERDIHFAWADKKGGKALDAYMEEKNQFSMDGLPTSIQQARTKSGTVK